MLAPGPAAAAAGSPSTPPTAARVRICRYLKYSAPPERKISAGTVNTTPDAIDSPAQNANQSLPAVFPSVHPRDQANLSEMYIFEINGPTFKLWNNGSASVTAGVVALRVWGFRYDLVPLTYDGTWQKRWVYGKMQPAPVADRAIVVVQTATYTASGSY